MTCQTWYQPHVKQSVPIILVLVSLSFMNCSKQGESQSETKSPVSAPLSVPGEKKDSTDHEKKDQESQEKDAPCCKAEEIHFEGLDVHGKFTGLPEKLESNKKYSAQLKIDGDHEGVDGCMLRVRASMKGMNHDLQFKALKKSERQFSIEPILFSMEGQWNVAYAWMNEAGETIDSCECKINVSPEAK